MKMSFDDEESFKEAARSLNFNNLPNDPDSVQQVGSSNICSSDPNIIHQVRRVSVRSNSSSSSTPPQEKSEDT